MLPGFTFYLRGIGLTVYAAEAHIFDFEELVHSILGTFAAKAGFLHAAKGRDLRGNDSGVDADNSVLECFRDAPNAGDVSSVEVSSQPEFGVIREGHRLRIRLEPKERRDRAEGFFARDGHLRRDAGENGRLKKAAAECMAMSADEYFCTFGPRVANVAFDFQHRRVVNQRPLRGARFETWGRLQRFHGHRELRGKRIVDAVMDQNPVRANASLAGIAVLRCDGALHGGIQIRVVKNDEGRIATELERKFFHCARALGHQDLSNLGRTGERQLSNDGIGGQFTANFRRRARQHVEYAFRNARTFGQLRKRKRRERCLRSGLQDDRAAGADGRARFAGDHGQGKIPRRDARDDSDGLFDDHNPLVGLMLRNGVAIYAFGLFAEPFKEGSRISDFAFRFGEGLALFQGHQPGQIVLVRHHQIEPAAQNSGAFFRCFFAPSRKSAIRRFDRLLRFSATQFRHAADDFAGCWVVDVDRSAGLGLDPLAVHVAGFAEQTGVLEFNSCASRFCRCLLHGKLQMLDALTYGPIPGRFSAANYAWESAACLRSATEASAASITFKPSSNCSSVTTSGTRMRTTLLNVPAVMMMRPCSQQYLAMALVSEAAGSRVCASRTSSMAHIPPRPRTSPTRGHFFCQLRARSSKYLPMAVERARRPSFSMVSMAASAAAQDAGWPQYVPPREPTPGASMISARPVTAAMGMPPPRDFAMVMRSGSMPKCSEANHFPVRAKPDCTSSAMKRMPCLRQMSWSNLK